MKYHAGFKYQLVEDESCQTAIKDHKVDTNFYALKKNGTLIAKSGFAWDGCSGSVDTDTNKRAGLFHDIGCLMVARNELPLHFMSEINDLFHELLIADGMNSIRAWWHYVAVDVHFAGNREPERRAVITLNKPERRHT
ncbi:MAG: hypothetical protein GY746_07435 [Gammaproteobacteria bacterium]|nr:hypothetical protein [Gammaproteobacteria bacterium]